MTTADIQVRPAVPGEEGTVLGLVRALARYEKLEDQLVATPADLARGLFGPTPRIAALIAWDGAQAVGLATYFYHYSTFGGYPVLYVEDVFVPESARGRRIGLRLFARMAQIALDEGAGGMNWIVLDWNAPSIAFYEQLGAKITREWLPCSLDRAGVERLAKLA